MNYRCKRCGGSGSEPASVRVNKGEAGRCVGDLDPLAPVVVDDRVRVRERLSNLQNVIDGCAPDATRDIMYEIMDHLDGAGAIGADVCSRDVWDRQAKLHEELCVYLGMPSKHWEIAKPQLQRIARVIQNELMVVEYVHVYSQLVPKEKSE